MHTVSIAGNGVGQSPAGAFASHRNFIKQERQPFQGDLDDRYVRISQADAFKAQQMFDNIPMLQIVEEINTESFRRGGMTIQIGPGTGKPLKPSDASGSETWMNLALQAKHSKQLFGFAVVTFAPVIQDLLAFFESGDNPLKILKVVPCILDPLQVDIYHYENLLREHNWIVRQKPNMGPGSDGSLLGPIIPLTFVFTDPNFGPRPDGSLRSKVLALRDAYDELCQFKLFALRAEERRSAPSLVTERVQHPKDPTVNGLIPNLDSMDCAGDRKHDQISAADRFADRLVRISNVFSPEQHNAIVKEYLAQSAIRGSIMMDDERVDLPAERKLARQVLAEAPSELKEKEIRFDQLVLQQFGIPPAMIQPESAHGKMVSNENAMEIYRQHLAAMKHELLTPILFMVRQIHQSVVREAYLNRHGGKQGLTYEKFYSDTKITVALHGLPPEDKLDQFYQQGLLRYDAYIQTLSGIHGIPLDYFEKEPAISREDLLTSGKASISAEQNKEKAKLEKQKLGAKKATAKKKKR